MYMYIYTCIQHIEVNLDCMMFKLSIGLLFNILVCTVLLGDDELIVLLLHVLYTCTCTCTCTYV